MSKLRSDELVNMEGDGAPSFPRGATSIEPTADNQVATKLYVDTALSASFGNAVSNTAPTNPAIGSFWTDTSVNPSALKTWDGTTWIEFAGTAAAAVGVVVSLPSLSATNLEHAPATITASAAQVSNATLFITKWYKDDVEIVGATGSTYVATEPGVYRYEERWADDAGNILTPSLNKTIELLSIEAPSITIPVADTGLPDFVYEAASSAIANVSQVTSDVPSVGSPTVFESDSTDIISSVYDSANQKVVIAYRDQGDNNCRVVVGTVSGTNISFGSSVIFDSQLNDISAAYDSNSNKIVIAYRDGQNNSYGTAIVGTVSGTSISFGSPVVYDSTYCTETSVVYDSTNQKVVIAYKDGSNPQPGTAIVGTVSGTSISFGSPTVFNSPGDTRDISTAFDSANGKVIISYCDYGNNYYGTAVVGTVSGTSISFGSEVVFESATTTNISSVYDPTNGKVVIAYRDSDNSGYGTAIVGTVSGTSISFGSPVVFNPTYTVFTSTVFDSANNKVIIAYQNRGNDNHGTAIAGTVSGTSISFDTASTFSFSSSNFISAVYDPNSNKVVAAFQNGGNNDYGTATVFSLASTATQLTLTDTTVSKVSDGSLVGGTTIDEVLTVGETVQAFGDDSYWIATLGGTSNDRGYGIAVDSSGNVYVTGQNNTTGGDDDLLIAKYDTSGTIQWQRTLGGASDEIGYAIAVDSSGNAYVFGHTLSVGAGSYEFLVAKYNTSGAIQWQRTLGGGDAEFGRDIAVDSSGNVYVTGFVRSAGAGNYDLFIAKYNTSGTIQWQRTLGGTNNDRGHGIAVDSSGNVYVTGYTLSAGAGSIDFLIAKYNTSGTIQWQRTLGGADIDFSLAIAVDSSGNVYATGYTNVDGLSTEYLIVKYNTSGTIQWQRTLGGTGEEIGYGIAVDSSGNVYVNGQTTSAGAGTYDLLIAKYNTSGAIQWQRTLGGTGDDRGREIAVDSSGNVYVTGQSASAGAGSDDILIAKLPDDGSLTGTYGSFTYASSSLTDASSSRTSSSSSLTSSTSSLTDSASSLTDSATNLTSSTTTLPAASGTVSASSGNTITLSNTSGTWSTGMKVQGVTTDTKDYPDPIGASAVTFASSEPVVTSGTVSAWDYAEWNLSYDAQFSGVVHEKAVPLTATGTQAGPDSFPIQAGTEYFVRTKYASFLPSGQSDWSAVTRFLTKANVYADDVFSTYLYTGNGGTQTINNGINLGSTIGSLSAYSSTLQETQPGVDFNQGGNVSDYNSGITWQEVITNGTLSGTNSDYLYSGSDALDIYVDLGEAVVATSFEIAPQGDTSNGATYNIPSTLHFYGSNDASSWTTLHQATAVSSNYSFYPGRLTSIPFSNSTAYRYYRVDFGTGASISEWQIPHDSGTSGEGGLVWIKRRDSSNGHFLVDTERGRASNLNSTSTSAAGTSSADRDLVSFNNNGFTVGPAQYESLNSSGADQVSWTFRKAPGFFDVVTYTGTGSNRTVAHNLGSVPGFIIVKRTSGVEDWTCYHRSLGAPYWVDLNNTNSAGQLNALFSTEPTSSVFTVGTHDRVNANGDSYVAYIFAHDDQSFGTNGDESIIKCGSYTGTGSAGNRVELGFEPQFVMVKSATYSDSYTGWYMLDTMRGFGVTTINAVLQANKTNAENPTFGGIILSGNGFELNASGSEYNGNGETYIYMAIRRPHKPPTAGTDVFAIDTKTASSANTPAYTSNFPVDLALRRDNITSTSDSFEFISRKTDSLIYANLSNAENAAGGVFTDYFARNNGWATGGSSSDSNDYLWMFRRAPGFFDTVTYTGDGSATRQISHNLEATPELIIVKSRSNTSQWVVWTTSFTLSNGEYITLNASSAKQQSNPPIFTTSAPTSTYFNASYSSLLNTQFTTNASSYTYIAYLFATLDGISKVGTYSGTGSNINVDCGFTAGARFVLIKRTDSSGDWYVWDTARGIVSGNDPYLLMNSNNAEVTNTDYIDPLNAGFTVTSSAPAALNANGGTYLFLAIA